MRGRARFFWVLLLLSAATTASAPDYQWTREAAAAAFPGTYNFPVFVVRNEMWAFQGERSWRSRDGKAWTQTSLPHSGLNGAHQKYVQLGDAIFALGTMTGNYMDLHLTSK